MNLKVIVFLFCGLAYTEAIDKVICYYESWQAYGPVKPEDLDPGLCTHIYYAFIGIQEDGNLKVEDDSLDIDQGGYSRVTGLKNQNPNLKVLLSVGGGAEGGAELFANMASDPSKRAPFIGSARYFIETYNFDGLDIDWEIPEAGDRENYITLLRELRAEFDTHGWLLTAAVRANPSEGYDVAQMNSLLDIINIMCYDFYGPWSSYTGQNSALFASSVESEYEKNNLNVAAGARNWLNAGVSPAKLAVGVAFYGRTFTLADPNNHGLHAPFTGPGVGSGALNYFEICRDYGGWTRVWDEEQQNPYKYSGDQWLGYDDPTSIQAKVNYIKSISAGGIMIWHVGGDDVHGVCGEKQALLKIINNGK